MATGAAPHRNEEHTRESMLVCLPEEISSDLTVCADHIEQPPSLELLRLENQGGALVARRKAAAQRLSRLTIEILPIEASDHGGLPERPSAVPVAKHFTSVTVEPVRFVLLDTCAQGCSPIVTSPTVDRHQAPVCVSVSPLADGSDEGVCAQLVRLKLNVGETVSVLGCWNREVVSTVRGEECHLRLLLVTGGTMKSSTYVGQ
ncbi:hypothetical protein M514_19501 [Trichuris suis]|uniref:Uncharacterized protein n=1 Tax=Trichuris suis TaxID=68888 RepID=A0A085NFJ3_9BILA|nr:hypothetical protein M514_19501 [Trichuris suis]